MNKVLYITANPKHEEKSYGLSIGREFLNTYKGIHPDDQVIEIDLYKSDIPFVDADVISGWDKLQTGTAFGRLTAVEQAKIENISKLTDQFINADKYIFVTPLWNFSIPPIMKAYIDTISIAGKTFAYTENGPIGMLKNKKALHIQASGGLYSEGDSKYFEFGNNYLKALLSFLGIKDFETIFIEGMALMPAEAENIKARALQKAVVLAKTF